MRETRAEQAARTRAEAATSRTQEHLAHTRTDTQTDTQREAAEALTAERQHLRDEALAERDELRVELDSVRCQTDTLTQELHREISELRTAHDQRVDALTEAVATARTSLAEQCSQLEARQRWRLMDWVGENYFRN